jgi:hypothetical protein
VDQVDQKISRKTHPANYARLEHNPGRLSALMPEEFSDYIAGLGFAAEPGLLVIPPRNHYFYDFEELKRVKILVNLMKLNHVRELKGFLRKLSELLHGQASFVGCFIDDRSRDRYSLKSRGLAGMTSESQESYENGIESRIPFINRIYGFIDAKTDRYLTRRAVVSLLNEFGFQVLNMTEMEGVTYFHSRKGSSGVQLQVDVDV